MGLRGSGKSTLAGALSRALNLPEVDLDRITPGLLECATVSEAWRKHGEAEFRRAETRALGEALRGAPSVIALGGGTPTAPGADDMIREARRAGLARTVYLRCEPDVLRRRLQSQPNSAQDRPSLTGTGFIEEIEQVFAARDPVYRRLADFMLEGDRTIEESAALILAWRRADPSGGLIP